MDDTPIPAPTRRVLVVDDEPTIRIALRRFFARMGWQVDEAADGHAALELLLADTPDPAELPFSIVLSDLRMPGLSGIDLYERLRLERPAVLSRIIFSTGDVVSEDAAAFVEATRCTVLQKPFELAALRELVERVVTTPIGIG
jgi:CheY-like chemotaxis protein